MRALAVVLLPVLIAACGGLDSPDLSVGAVEGRIPPADGGRGRVYVLGAPQLRADLSADGTFRIDGVPVGESSLVAFDGGARAGLLPVVVRGAEVTYVGPRADASAPSAADPSAGWGQLPLAGGIDLRATTPGGAVVRDARWTVIGTEWVEVLAEYGDGWLWPLPPGRFAVVVRAAGHRDALVTIDVRAGEGAKCYVTLEPAL